MTKRLSVLAFILWTVSALAQSINGTPDQNVTAPPPYMAGSGAANALAGCPAPAMSIVVANQTVVRVLPNAANTTTTPTFALCSFSPLTVVKASAGAFVAVAAADYTTTIPAEFLYVGTYWQLLNPQTSGASGSTVQNNGSTVSTSNQVGVLPYTCADSSGSGTVQSCTTSTSFTLTAKNCFVYQTTTANSSTSLTIAVNGGSAINVAVVSSSGWTTTLSSSPASIPANEPMLACYDGTNLDMSATGVGGSSGGSGNMSFTPPGAWSGTSAYPTVGTVVTYNGASYVLNTAVAGTGSAAFVQANSANNASSLAFSSNVTGGHLITVVVGSVGVGSTLGSIAVSDTLGTVWTQAILQTGCLTVASAIWYGRATASGADTISFSGASGGSAQMAIAEFSGLMATTEGTAGGCVSSSTPATVSLTPSITNTTIVAGIAGGLPDSYGAASGFTIPANGQSATTFHGSVALDYQLTVGTSAYNAGFTSGTTDSYSTSAAAFELATSNLTPDVDTGHWTLLGLQASAINNTSDLTVAVGGTQNKLNISGGPTRSGIQQQAYTYAADSGTANAYAVTLSPAPTIVAGSVASLIVGHSNTGASTLAVNGGGAIAVKKQGAADLISGDWVAGQAVTVIYDGSHWQWTGNTAGTGGAGFTLTTTGACATATLIGTVLNIAPCHQLVGTGSFSDVSGTIANNTFSGVVTGVTRTGAGSFTIAFPSAPTVYTVACLCGNTGVSFVVCGSQDSPPLAVGATGAKISCSNPSTAVDVKLVNYQIFTE